jgi:hypothetical protein
LRYPLLSISYLIENKNIKGIIRQKHFHISPHLTPNTHSRQFKDKKTGLRVTPLRLRASVRKLFFFVGPTKNSLLCAMVENNLSQRRRGAVSQ